MTEAAGNGSAPEATAIYSGADNAAFTTCNSLLVEAFASDASEAKQASDQSARIYRQTKLLLLLVMIASALLCTVVGALLVRGVCLPLRRITELMQRLSGHDLSAAVQGLQRRDGIGCMARFLEVF